VIYKTLRFHLEFNFGEFMDVEQILHKLDEAGLVKLHKKNGEYYMIHCPIHNDGNERHPSCGVLLHDQLRAGRLYPEGWVHCFTCGWSKPLPDTISEILRRNNMSGTGMDWLKEFVPNFSDTDFDYLLPKETISKLNMKFALQSFADIANKVDEKFVSEEELQGYRYTVPYMYDRKLNDEVIEKFDVGVDLHYVPSGRKREVPCITFPVRNRQGKTQFIVRRSIAGKNFYLPKDITKSVYGLYELPKDSKVVIIAESCFNVLTSYVYGVPALGLLGTGSGNQLDVLKTLGVSEFVIGTDNDEAGDKGANRIRKALSQVAIIRRMHLPIGKDINDLSKDEFWQIFNARY